MQELLNRSSAFDINYRTTTQLPEAVARGQGRGGGSKPVFTPPHNTRCVGAVAMTDAVNTDQECFKRPRLEHSHPDPPVKTYPDRNRFSGTFQFQVGIQGTGTKLIVTPSGRDEDSSCRTIYTERGHMVTIWLTHTGSLTKCRHRFLLVFSKDAEASHPVSPCKNDRKEAHPNHMLEVKAGERDASVEWPSDPHPSVVVTPIAQGQHYTYQLTFLCRNSCVMRKDLTLLIQLEDNNVVVGREVFKVKVSACPRRDSATPHRRPITAAAASRPSPSSSFSSSSSSSFSHTPNTAYDELSEDVTKAGRKMARLVYLEQYFRDHFPDQHSQATENFCRLWDTGKFTGQI